MKRAIIDINAPDDPPTIVDVPDDEAAAAAAESAARIAAQPKRKVSMLDIIDRLTDAQVKAIEDYLADKPKALAKWRRMQEVDFDDADMLSLVKNIAKADPAVVMGA